MILHLLSALVSLSFLIFIHEMGHFLVAKKNGVRVSEFGFGYPPLAKKLFESKGTTFTLNWIPFGGFVRLDGEEALEDIKLQKKMSKDRGLFFNKSIKTRLAVILAGPMVNFIFGIFAFFIVFLVWGIPLTSARISEISPNSPAQLAGIPTNVEITRLSFEKNSQQISKYSQVSQLISQHLGETVEITTTGTCHQLACDQTEQKFDVYVRTAEETPQDQGSIGVVFQTSVFFPWYQMPFVSIKYGFIQAFNMSGLVLTTLSDMMGSIFTKGKIPEEISGPVGIMYFANQIELFNQGIIFLLNLSGMLSINLAIINILPIPALDGGRALFIVLEKIVNKEKLQRWELKVNSMGYLFLLGLIVLITIKDVLFIFK